MKVVPGLGAALVATLAVMAATAIADTTVTYKNNQGWIYDGTTYNLNDERCGLASQTPANDGSTGQFPTWNQSGNDTLGNLNQGDQDNTGAYRTGQGYLVWVLTANGASSATLNLPDQTIKMYKVGGTFKFASKYYNPDQLDGVGENPVTATYKGRATGNVQLTVSHGCQPFTTQGAWCSPGFWQTSPGNPTRNDGAWALTGIPRTEDYNAPPVPDINNIETASGHVGGLYTFDYVDGSLVHHPGTTAPVAPSGDPSLQQLLDSHAGDYLPGAGGAFGIGFNAVGAYLTDHIPGFSYDSSLVGNEEACPIGPDGTFK